ncbi:MAG TPA: hypothetical protein VK815_10895 [Candidatus Acidoferrales bacterium]|nr:hypothetical protein [Candidatus Acidoferrales bacterium]
MLNRNIAIILSAAYALLGISLFAAYLITFHFKHISVGGLIKIHDWLAITWPSSILAAFIFGLLIRQCGVLVNKKEDTRLQLGPFLFYSQIALLIFSALFFGANSYLYDNVALPVSADQLKYDEHGWVQSHFAEVKAALLAHFRFRLAGDFAAWTIAFVLALMGFIKASANSRLNVSEFPRNK